MPDSWAGRVSHLVMAPVAPTWGAASIALAQTVAVKVRPIWITSMTDRRDHAVTLDAMESAHGRRAGSGRSAAREYSQSPWSPHWVSAAIAASRYSRSLRDGSAAGGAAMLGRPWCGGSRPAVLIVGVIRPPPINVHCGDTVAACPSSHGQRL